MKFPKIPKIRNPLKDLEFPERVLLALVIFIIGLFIWDSVANGALDRTNIIDVFKAIEDIFTYQ